MLLRLLLLLFSILYTGHIKAYDTITVSKKEKIDLGLALKDTLHFSDSITKTITIFNNSTTPEWHFLTDYWQEVQITYDSTITEGGWGNTFQKQHFFFDGGANRGPGIPLYLPINEYTNIQIKIKHPIVRAFDNNNSCGLIPSKKIGSIYNQKLSFIQSLIIGILILALYNLFLFFITKDASFIKYSITQTLFALLWINTYGFSVYAFEFSLTILRFLDNFLSLLYILSYVWFSRAYLNTKNKDLKMNFYLIVLQYFIAVYIVLYIILSIFNFHTADYYGSFFVTKIISPIGVILLLISIIRAFIKKNRDVNYFVVATTIFIISIIITNLAALQLIPKNILSQNMILFGAILEAILFSIGLASKINQTQKEKEEAQKKLFIQLKENQIIKDDFSKGLEKQVLERTIELKEKNKKINTTLQEKEAVIKEIHHRVKNNLQLMYSFMSLQANRANNNEIKKAISENKGRIKTLAIVHDKLSLSQNAETIDIQTYLPGIVDRLSTLSYKGSINVNCEIVSLNLPLKKAIYVGLIVNEILTNTLKYADFNSKSNITFYIKANIDNSKLNFTLYDDGPSNSNYVKRQNSLGELIILDLAKQLKAKIDVNNNFKYYISIPII